MIALILIAFGVIIFSAWLMLYRGYKQYERDQQVFKAKPQSPSDSDYKNLTDRWNEMLDREDDENVMRSNIERTYANK